jgi:RHS repeat-associated protein
VFGNRTEKDVTVGGVTTTTRYAYDMSNPTKAGAIGTAGSDIWATFSALGSLTNRELQGDGVDQHLAYVTSSNAYWYLTDHLNSIRSVINNSGTVQDSIVYDGYGNITYQTPSPATTPLYSYTGRELDVETGLQYNRARYYDATTGRWFSQDPMGFHAGDSNLYRYVNNQPTNEADPSGALPESTPIGRFVRIFRELVLQIKVRFQFQPARDWTAAETAKLQASFTTDVEKLWNANPFLLHPSGGERLLEVDDRGRAKYVQDLLPRLAVRVVNTDEDLLVIAQHNKGEGAYYARGTKNLRVEMNSLDRTMAHEFGHFLGLEHPGEYVQWSNIGIMAKERERLQLPVNQQDYIVDGLSLMGSGQGMRGFYFTRWLEYLNKNEPEGRPWDIKLDESNPNAKSTVRNWEGSVLKGLEGDLPLLGKVKMKSLFPEKAPGAELLLIRPL